MNNTEKFEIKMFSSEVKKGNETDITAGCCLFSDPNPESITIFDSKEEALSELRKEKYRPTCEDMGNYYLVQEYMIECYYVDDEGDFFSGSDYDSWWMFNIVDNIFTVFEKEILD